MRVLTFQRGVVLCRSRKYAIVRKFRPKLPKLRKSASPLPCNRGLTAEVRNLQRITKDVIPDEKRKVAMPIIHNLAFLKVKLEVARNDLLYENIFTEYDNGGGQSGLREHPGFSAYNKLFTTFQRGIKQLCDMMPTGAAAADALTDYLAGTRYD